MADTMIITGVLMDETVTYSYLDVCERCHLSEDALVEMLEHGLFTPHVTHLENIQFDQKTLGKIQAACRLQRDLELNLPGVVLVLELLDELAYIRDELSILQRHLHP